MAKKRRITSNKLKKIDAGIDRIEPQQMAEEIFEEQPPPQQSAPESPESSTNAVSAAVTNTTNTVIVNQPGGDVNLGVLEGSDVAELIRQHEQSKALRSTGLSFFDPDSQINEDFQKMLEPSIEPLRESLKVETLFKQYPHLDSWVDGLGSALCRLPDNEENRNLLLKTTTALNTINDLIEQIIIDGASTSTRTKEILVKKLEESFTIIKNMYLANHSSLQAKEILANSIARSAETKDLVLDAVKDYEDRHEQAQLNLSTIMTDTTTDEDIRSAIQKLDNAYGKTHPEYISLAKQFLNYREDITFLHTRYQEQRNLCEQADADLLNGKIITDYLDHAKYVVYGQHVNDLISQQTHSELISKVFIDQSNADAEVKEDPFYRNLQTKLQLQSLMSQYAVDLKYLHENQDTNDSTEMAAQRILDIDALMVNLSEYQQNLFYQHTFNTLKGKIDKDNYAKIARDMTNEHRTQDIDLWTALKPTDKPFLLKSSPQEIRTNYAAIFDQKKENYAQVASRSALRALTSDDFQQTNFQSFFDENKKNAIVNAWSNIK